MSKKSPEIIKKLKEAHQKSIEYAIEARNTDITKWARWELRKEYLNREINRFTRLNYGSNIPKRVFVSYTKKNGKDYYDILKKKLAGEGFSTTDGFQKNKDPNGVIVRSVLTEMKRSTVYVGIYTNENLLTIEGKDCYTPSVWTIEEKGMALGLSMPVLLICEKGIHEHFFSKTTGAFEHCITENIHHFQLESVDRAVELIINKYYDKLNKYGDKDGFDMFEF